VLPGRAVVEGEALQRSRSTPIGDEVSSGGYVLAGYKLRPWLQPIVKWERLVFHSPDPRRHRQLVLGANALTKDENVRLQVDWMMRRERPVEIDNNELVAQLIVVF
jgi:hypothetical protein